MHDAVAPDTAQCRPDVHGLQVTPPIPHAPNPVPGVTHETPEQHPAHVVGSHTQVPPLHCCPVPQGAHESPGLPHRSWVSPVTHAEPLQHPLHEFASQVQWPAFAWPLNGHSCPPTHPTHDAPLRPHVLKPLGWHCWALSQHPAHDDPSQTHFPALAPLVGQC